MSEFQRFIAQAVSGQHLSADDAARAFQIVMTGGATPAQIAGLLVALKMKGETVDEIAGAATAMRAKMTRVAAPDHAIDVCGTGGDGKGTYNVSTAVAFVVAAAGVPVAKHGNKSVSSKSGSADVLASLGVNVQAESHVSERALREAGICFMFAPLYHRAARHVAPVRQELGMRTIFNLLGPLVNPASPKRQLLGVYSEDLLVPVAQVLARLGSVAAWVVHGNDGLDELTLTGPSQVAELRDGVVTRFEITPEDAGLERADADAITGGHAAGNAYALSLLLQNHATPYRDIVLLNAGAALKIADKAATIADGVLLAREALESGRAKAALDNLIRITNES